MRRTAGLSRLSGAIAALVIVACASTPTPPPAIGPDPDPAYPGRCSFVELQAIERPSPGRGSGPDNLGVGTVELVATYRPGKHAERKPVGYAFRVSQERVDDLRAHLQQQPDILCDGESMGGDANAPGPRLPSFEGQQGRPVSAESTSTGEPTPTGTVSP